MPVKKYKTTIKCNGCIAEVTPKLDAMEEVNSWKVDLNHADRILEVDTKTEDDSKLVDTLKSLGFEATPIKPKSRFNRLFGG